MKNKLYAAFAILCVAIVIGAIAYAGFWMQRTMNYNLYYKAQVEQQVNEILEQRIQQECLVEQQ